MRRFLSALIALGIVFVLVKLIGTIPPYGEVDLSKRVSEKFITKSVNGFKEKVVYEKSRGLEEGSANVVTSIVVNYRGFDTLGEVTVLFVSALGVGLILPGLKREGYGREPNFILKTSVGIIFPLIIAFGVYIFVHGHLTPGGGFPGGTILAAGILLLYLSNERYRLSESAKVVEGSGGSLFVVLGLLGMAFSGAFLTNFLPTGVVGKLFSAGIVPMIYIIIGFKVGAELSTIIADLHKEG